MRTSRRAHFGLWITSLALSTLVGCGGGGGGGGGGGDATPLDGGDNHPTGGLPTESSSSAEGFRAIAFTFSETPQSGREVQIGLLVDGTVRATKWNLLSVPEGSQADLSVGSQGMHATLTPDRPGQYEVEVDARVDGEDAMGSIAFGVREAFPYDSDKVERESSDAKLEEIVAPISNQVFAFSTTHSEEDLRDLLDFYPEVEVLGYDEVEGLLLQFDDVAPDFSDLLEELRSEPEVESLVHRMHEGSSVPRVAVPPNDGSPFNDGGDNWHLEKIGALEAWEETTGSNEFLVGVADSGFHANHEDLFGRFASMALAPVQADAPHGMGVAGAIGARTDNARGISGINRTTRIVATRFDMFGALDTVRNGRKVLLVNNSWITAGYIPGNFLPNNATQTKKRAKLTLASTRKFRKAALGKYKDRLIVWAAGNGIGNGGSTSDSNGDGKPDNYGVNAIYDNGSIHLDDTGKLSRLENTIVVAALASDNRLVYYSEFGRTVDIAAPTHYRSTSRVAPTGASLYFDGPYGVNTGRGFAGTSAAAPVVTGAASLVFSADPDLKAREVKKILIETATEDATVRYTKPDGSTALLGEPIPILNMGAAVKAGTPPEVVITADPGTIVNGERVVFDSEIETGLRPYTYEWDFGDGTTGSSPDETHVYSRGGRYTVELTVIDACDREATASVEITVTETGPDPETAPESEDWVVWYTGNVDCWGAPLLYVTHRAGFEREELRSSFRGGGIDPNELAEKREMMGGFESRAEAMDWICPQISGFRRHFWCGAHYLVGGEPFRMGNLDCDLSDVPEVTS